MKRFYTAALCALLFSFASSAQQPDTAKWRKIPLTTNKSDAQKSPAAAPKSAPADYSQEPFVIEQYFTAARFENDGSSDRHLPVRSRVQSDAGVQQLGELIFGYNSANEVMDVHFVRVKKKDGSVITAPADAVKDMSASVARDAPEYTDYKEKHVTVPSLHAGDTIEYEIATRTVTPLAPANSPPRRRCKKLPILKETAKFTTGGTPTSRAPPNPSNPRKNRSRPRSPNPTGNSTLLP